MASIHESPTAKNHEKDVVIIPVTKTKGYCGAKIVQFEYLWLWNADHVKSLDMTLKYEVSLRGIVIISRSASTTVGSSRQTIRIQSLPTDAAPHLQFDMYCYRVKPILIPLLFKIELIIYSGHIQHCANQQECEIVDCLQQLFLTHECSDVTFDICGQEVPAHKGILSILSPVFSAMFKHEMKEKREHRVDITDIEPEVFLKMLQFIYTNRVENKEIKNMVDKLLVAADKYEVGGLKATCEKVLIGQLTAANAANTLIFADLHGAKDLKKKVLSFINEGLKDVMETQGFKSMTISHPHLTVEILQWWTKIGKIGSDTLGQLIHAIALKDFWYMKKHSFTSFS